MRKVYHSIRVMGRSASHISLECALQTHPILCFAGEEEEEKGITLTMVVEEVAQVAARSARGLAIIPA